uniref:Uncharacterized protein n=1 Tax=Anguilla anguilla TaxID=7936 RepID=A0A0E9T097_ANGAN
MMLSDTGYMRRPPPPQNPQVSWQSPVVTVTC